MGELAQSLRKMATRIEELELSKEHDWREIQIKTFGQLSELREALDGGPRPMCRDCADCDGICPNDGLPCEPQDRALEQIRRLRAKSTKE